MPHHRRRRAHSATPRSFRRAYDSGSRPARAARNRPAVSCEAGPISEAVNLYAVALRTRKRLLYDAESVKITNAPEANRYLSRDYRKGWEPESV